MSDKTLTYQKATSTTHILGKGTAAFELGGTDVGAARDKKPKDKKQWTRNGEWVKWGPGNDFPQAVMRDLRSSTIGKRILNDRAKRHVSKGVFYYKLVPDEETGERKKIQLMLPDVEEFLEVNKVNQVQKAIVEDLETFYNGMPYFRTSLDKKRIASYGYKKMYHSRMGLMNEQNGSIEKVYHSYNWPNPNVKSEVIPFHVYDELSPLKHPRFVMPLRYSTSDECMYYELAIWDSVRQNGWMKIDQLVPKLKQHIFENQAILKYHIKIPYDYWVRRYGEECWAKKTESQREAAVELQLREMDSFLKGAENSGKSFISFYGHDPVTQKPYPGFEITAIDNKLKSDDYLPDASAAYAAICFAMGYDPTLIGASLIDKRSSGGSGSDKRESLANLQSSMPIDREVSLEPLRMITRVNKWNEQYKEKLGNSRIYWGYLDTDTTDTQDKISPKDRAQGGKPQKEVTD